MNLSSTESILKIVAIVVVALWGCAGATRLLYPGVWKWITDKFSRCFLCLFRPCRYIIGVSKPTTTDQDFVGLKQHYILPVSVGDGDEAFQKSFSDKPKPRKSEGSLKNPQRKREMTNLAVSEDTRGRRLTNEAQIPRTGSFIDRSTSGPRRVVGRGRKRGGRGRGGKGRGRSRDGNFDYSDTERGRNSLFDGTNPLVDGSADDDDECVGSPEDDDVETGGESYGQETQASTSTGNLLEF